MTPDDPAQLRLDLEDANLRLKRMRDAIRERDAAAEQVRELTAKLAFAKRRRRDAEYNLSLLMSDERRK